MRSSAPMRPGLPIMRRCKPIDIMRGALEYAFEHEDMPLIRDSHRLMAGRDFWDLKPLVLEGDGGGVRALRLLRRMIAAEQGQNQTEDAAA